MDRLFGRIFDIQHFCTHDGPGIRTTVFLKGCPLHCAWCHNPESQRPERELLYHSVKCAGCNACERACPFHAAHKTLLDDGLRRERCADCRLCADACVYGAIEQVGRDCSVEEVLGEVVRDESYYRNSGGGMTLSGGEALFQPEFSRELLSCARARGIHTAVETSGYARTERLLSLVPCTDLWLWDVKMMDEELHHRLTGVPLAPILKNLKAADAAGASVILRILFIPEFHDSDSYLRRLAGLIRSLKHCKGFEIVPYHRLGLSKREKLGRESLTGLYREPTVEETARFRERLQALVRIF